jgi:hypothetical protein
MRSSPHTVWTSPGLGALVRHGVVGMRGARWPRSESLRRKADRAERVLVARWKLRSTRAVSEERCNTAPRCRAASHILGAGPVTSPQAATRAAQGVAGLRFTLDQNSGATRLGLEGTPLTGLSGLLAGRFQTNSKSWFACDQKTSQRHRQARQPVNNGDPRRWSNTSRLRYPLT